MSVVYHEPALLQPVLDGLAIQRDGHYVDVTFGGGGHSRAILERLEEEGRLVAFDQDKDATANVPSDNRFTLVQDNFRTLQSALAQRDMLPVDGLLADLGVSFHQFDEPSRGFSIRFDSDLDMRMNQRTPLTARDILNTRPEKELAKIFREYGELKNAGRVAHAIALFRENQHIVTVDDLKRAVASCTPRGKENTFYACLFQALRIEVNDELGALRELLRQSPEVIRSGGRLVVISYHSLEDRLVKNFINTGNTEGELHKDFYGQVTGLSFRAITKKPIVPDEEEIARNPRSRSAKLRIAERI